MNYPIDPSRFMQSNQPIPIGYNAPRANNAALSPRSAMPQQKQRGWFPNMSPTNRNLFKAAGMALASQRPGMFGPAAQQMNSRQQETDRSNATSRYFAKWFSDRKMPELAQMAANGAWKEASAIYKTQTSQAQKPKYLKGQDGRQYLMNGANGEPTLAIPNAPPKPPVNGISIGPDGQLIINSKQDEKNRANAILENQQTAAGSTKLLDTIKGMRAAINKTGYMGPGASAYDTVDNFMEGVLPEGWNLPGSSEARAVVKTGGMKFVLDQIQETKGAISEREMDLFAGAAPGLSQTKKGSLMLLDIAEKVARRQQMRTAEMEKYRQKNNTLEGFESLWAQYTDSNPIVTEDLFSGLDSSKPEVIDGFTIRQKQ